MDLQLLLDLLFVATFGNIYSVLDELSHHVLERVSSKEPLRCVRHLFLEQVDGVILELVEVTRVSDVVIVCLEHLILIQRCFAAVAKLILLEHVEKLSAKAGPSR